MYFANSLLLSLFQALPPWSRLLSTVSPSIDSILMLVTNPLSLAPSREHCLSANRIPSYEEGHKCFAIAMCFAREFQCNHPQSFVIMTVTQRLLPKVLLCLNVLRK